MNKIAAGKLVQTRHPLGKRNRPVSAENYELFKRAIVTSLRDRPLTLTELVEQVTHQLRGEFEGNVSWHTMTVKLDLEARGIIVRTASRPQRYRLA